MVIKTKEEITAAIQAGGGYLSEVICPNDVYHAHESIGQTNLKLLSSQTPRHYRRTYTHRGVRKETAEMKFGTMAHARLLEPESFHDRYAVMPTHHPIEEHDAGTNENGDKIPLKINRRTNIGKEFWKKMEKLHAGKIIITREEHDICDRMLENVMNHKNASRYLTGGRSELSFFAPVPSRYADKIPMSRKCRPDYFIKGEDKIIVTDFKTARDASPEGFAREVGERGYHVQNAWYVDIIEEIYDLPVEFVFVVSEKSDPYETAVYQLDVETLDQGRDEYIEGLRKMAHCFEQDEWPAFSDEVVTIGIPDWRKRQAENKIIESLE